MDYVASISVSRHNEKKLNVHFTMRILLAEIGQLYAIAGNSQKVGLCQYIKEYSKMTQVEKRGIAGAYKKGCGCEVLSTIGHLERKTLIIKLNIIFLSQINLCMNNRGCDPAPRSCEWSLFNECETDYGICVPLRNVKSSSQQTKCQWRRSPLYQSCLLDP
jgi:metalloproteinase inhibitor 3